MGGSPRDQSQRSAVLQVNNKNMVPANHGTAGLQSQIIDTTEALLEDLRPHDRRADRENHAAIQFFDPAAEQPEIGAGGAAYCGAVEHGMIGNDVVADAGMNGQGDVPLKALREEAVLFARMRDFVASGGEAMLPHGLKQFGARGRQGVRRGVF